MKMINNISGDGVPFLMTDSKLPYDDPCQIIYTADYLRSGIVVNMCLMYSGKVLDSLLLNPFDHYSSLSLNRLSKMRTVMVVGDARNHVCVQAEYIRRSVRSLLLRRKNYDPSSINWDKALSEYEDQLDL